MKEITIILGIMLIVVGDILFEMNWNAPSRVLGFVLVSIGVIMYLLIVDSLDDKKTKDVKKKKASQQILPIK